jgi:hypothetical protein
MLFMLSSLHRIRQIAHHEIECFFATTFVVSEEVMVALERALSLGAPQLIGRYLDHAQAIRLFSYFGHIHTSWFIMLMRGREPDAEPTRVLQPDLGAGSEVEEDRAPFGAAPPRDQRREAVAGDACGMRRSFIYASCRHGRDPLSAYGAH